jgi:enoyl-CoA hydratase/carnithine racemase
MGGKNEFQMTMTMKKAGPIGILTWNNPPKNLMKEPEFIDENLLQAYLHDSSIKGILVKGTGRHFSAGADLVRLRALAKDESLLFQKMTAGKRLIQMMEEAEIPIVAAISGICFGAGLELALACHIRFCSDNALFAFPEVNHGFMPGLGGTITLTRLVGSGKAAAIILSGDMLNAERALETGVTDHVIHRDQLYASALGALEKMVSGKDSAIIRSVMQSIRNSNIMSFEKALEQETRLFCSLAARDKMADEA